MAMEQTASELITGSGLSPDLAFLFSDEISLYFSHLPFGGRIEKIDSILASHAASTLTIALGLTEPIAFDARVIQVTPVVAVEYLVARQGEAWRNHINAYCQHVLTGEGMTASEAAEALLNQPSRVLHDMMYRRGVNLAKTPAWQRRGILLYKVITKKEVTDTRTGAPAESYRPRVVTERDLPLFSSPEGKVLLQSLFDIA